MKFDAVYYEPDSLSYPLGEQLKEQFSDLPWIPGGEPQLHRGNEGKKENAEFGRK